MFLVSRGFYLDGQWHHISDNKTRPWSPDLLGNFSLLEICYVSVTLPRILTSLWTQRRTVSLVACATQMCFILILGATECFLLAVMVYDRYVAICSPLHYPLVMNYKVCIQLVVGSWISGIPIQIGRTGQIFSLPFCGSKLIHHFFCIFHCVDGPHLVGGPHWVVSTWFYWIALL